MSQIIVNQSTPATVVVQLQDILVSIDVYGVLLPPILGPVITKGTNTTVPVNFISGTCYNITATATVFLPSAVGQAGKILTVKRIGGGVVTIQCHGAETIDESNTAPINRFLGALTFKSDGVNWWIIA